MSLYSGLLLTRHDLSSRLAAPKTVYFGGSGQTISSTLRRFSRVVTDDRFFCRNPARALGTSTGRPLIGHSTRLLLEISQAMG